MGIKLSACKKMKEEALGHLRPHYLLELDKVYLESDNSELEAFRPDWVQQSLCDTPFVVVRRERVVNGMIPVGVRGRSREQRFATLVPFDSVNRIITPFDLMDRLSQPCEMADTEYGALRTLACLSETWKSKALHWGPGGSVGFELATGASSISHSSDLDIVIYADKTISFHELQALWNTLPDVDTRIDIQIETPHCGFSLAEYIRSYPNIVLLKTADGPVLSSSPPWAAVLATSTEV
jgi:phosphoribosyl-dephospho-CoA transferase